MGLLIGLLTVVAAADLPESYLLRVEGTLGLCRHDVAAMKAPAEQAAARLAAGGAFWAGGQGSWVSELSGRAGGFMMLKGLGDQAPAPEDVVLFAPDAGEDVPQVVLESGAMVVVFGSCPSGAGLPCFSNHAEEGAVSPTLANAIPAWVFTGELVAALTRLGKMPVMYESIGAYGGYARMRQYDNGTIAFHDDRDVPPVEAGVLGNRFLDRVGAMLERIEKEERADLDRAGAWAREAKAAGKALVMYSMGHLFPDEVGKTAIGRLFRSAVWNAGFPHHSKPDDTYALGDLVVFIGYQHPPEVLLGRARPAGARVVYVTVRADRDYVRDEDVIRIDPMWDWPDACVELDGYDIPVLAASGIVNGAIAWEIYRLAAE